MSIDELWGLHEEIGSLLTQRMTAERRELDKLRSAGRLEHSRKKSAVPIQRSLPDFRIPLSHPKPRPVAGNNPAGLVRCSMLGRAWRIFAFANQA